MDRTDSSSPRPTSRCSTRMIRTWWTGSWPRTTVNHNAFVADGREANRQFWTAFFAALPDLSATMEDLVISGDRVVGRFVYRGTHTGELMGIPASGNPVEMRSIDIWRVEDAMFVEHWDELNLLQLFQQMGALPPLGGGPEAQS